jgi:hypothetical protein
MPFRNLWLPLPDLPQGASHRDHQLREGSRQSTRACYEAEANAHPWQSAPLSPVGLPETPPRSVPHHAAPEPATCSKAHGSRPGLPPPEQHERRLLHAGPAPEQPVKLGPGSQPLRPRQRCPRGRRPGHFCPSPSTGAALWRAAASAPSGRPSSPCVRGIRGSSPAGDGSVGTSASRLPPSPRNAHSLPILQRRSRPRQAPWSSGRGSRPVAALENPVLWWAARGGPACKRRVNPARGDGSGRRFEGCQARRQGSRTYPPPWISVCVTPPRRKAPHAR